MVDVVRNEWMNERMNEWMNEWMNVNIYPQHYQNSIIWHIYADLWTMYALRVFVSIFMIISMIPFICANIHCMCVPSPDNPLLDMYCRGFKGNSTYTNNSLKQRVFELHTSDTNITVLEGIGRQRLRVGWITCSQFGEKSVFKMRVVIQTYSLMC